MEHGDDRTAERVILGQVTPEEALLRAAAVRGKHRHDDDVRIERAHCLHTNQFETKRAIRELLDGTKCGISCNAKVTERAGDSVGLPNDALAFEPLELDLGAQRCPTARDERRNS